MHQKNTKILMAGGPLGVGKTTSMEALHKHFLRKDFSWKFFEEPILDSKLFKNYYPGLKTAFDVQMAVLEQKKNQYLESADFSKTLNPGGFSAIGDMSLFGDYSFAKNLFAFGYISDKNFQIYQTAFFKALEEIKKVGIKEILIYFHVPIENIQVIVNRIVKRAKSDDTRKDEATFIQENLAYLESLLRIQEDIFSEQGIAQSSGICEESIFIDWSKENLSLLELVPQEDEIAVLEYLGMVA